MDLGSDEALVHEVQEGSILAFEILVKRYEGKLLSFVYRILRNELDAEEIVQDAFFKVYTIIEQVDTNKKFSSYLFEIAKNASISRLRQLRRNIPLDDSIMIETDEAIYEGLAQKEKAERIKKAVNKLSPKYRNAIKLYYFEDLSYEEISTKMHLPLNTVRTHLARAKAALKKILR